jgi:RNA polymerase sigma-70 factor, ECF subfamily
VARWQSTEPRRRWFVTHPGLLDPDATAITDGGGLVSALLRPIEGGEQVAHLVVDVGGGVPNLTILERAVNDQPVW